MDQARIIDSPYLDVPFTGPTVTRVRIAIPAPPLPELPTRASGAPMVLEAVAHSYSVAMVELVGRGRTKAVAEARQLSYWLLRRLTRMSFPEIGRALGRDHTSVMAGIKAIERRRARDAGFVDYSDRMAVAVAARLLAKLETT